MSNTFGEHFRMTTWGESHGPAIGVVIDGCPPNIVISDKEIQLALNKRAPGQTPWTSPRKEPDCIKILSGLFNGKTTGAPIACQIDNLDVDSSKYESIKHLHRPGHASLTYQAKYGNVDYRGGGRASARETAARVVAGVFAKKILSLKGISVKAHLKQIGHLPIQRYSSEHLEVSPLFCPDPQMEIEWISFIEMIQKEGDSIGGIVEFQTEGLPSGLGDPIYRKLEALMASAMLSIPASKGFEIGEGFNAALMKGSDHNPLDKAGGTLGGISTGTPLIIRVPFKPTSSIQKEQQTTDLEGNEATFILPEGSRHDPCVAIRAVPVVEAMGAIVLADRLLKG
ncbi:chorismate synthase [Chlamydiales bacterium]|nr:chorismate synthase [Chlamydiales bacterium]